MRTGVGNHILYVYGLTNVVSKENGQLGRRYFNMLAFLRVVAEDGLFQFPVFLAFNATGKNTIQFATTADFKDFAAAAAVASVFVNPDVLLPLLLLLRVKVKKQARSSLVAGRRRRRTSIVIGQMVRAVKKTIDISQVRSYN